MAVVIDEIVSDPAPEARGTSGGGTSVSGGGDGGGGEPDLDKLDFEFRRFHQRCARRFAD